MNYTTVITKEIEKNYKKDIFIASKLYKNKFSYIPEPTFFKVLSRLEKGGMIKRVSKGIYCMTAQGRFGEIGASEKNISQYFLGKNKNKGVLIGYKMFTKYGMTTQIPKNVEMVSVVPEMEKTTIFNMKIQRINIKLDQSTIKMIELLEVLQNYTKIEELNYKKLVRFLGESVRYYNETDVIRILSSIKYKKSTIASLVKVLRYYRISTELSSYLKGTSKYKTIDIEGLYETA